MTADFRALCAELAEFVARLTKHYYEPAELLTRARAALADEPAVPEGREPASVVSEPTYDDLSELCSQHGLDVDSWPLEKFDALWETARAVLARWGTPNFAETRSSLGDAPQPVPVSERLPEPGDCLDEGWAWFFYPQIGWRQAVPPVTAAYTHWLPAHAIPLPDAND